MSTRLPLAGPGRHSRRGPAYALAAAVLFGVSAPLARLLIVQASPQLIAGLLYLGSGVGLAVVTLARGRSRKESPLRRGDVPWLAGAVASGGVIAPLLLMLGLSRADAAAGALLLNLEGVLTALIAWFVFRENFDRRIALGMLAIVAGGVTLSWSGAPTWGFAGPLLIGGACLGWAIDNNLTQKVSGGDPVQIAMLKGLVAGVVNAGLALYLGASLPSVGIAALTLLLGFVSYGVSLSLFVYALRLLGTARTGAYFSIAPFVGAALALVLFRQAPGLALVFGAALMAGGVWLHVTERHEHEHRHELLDHEHYHVHDEHHRHEHGPGDPPGEPHAHRHRHDPMTHSHPHYPDIHHRHDHEQDHSHQ
jgi:drug/metabolite transporter (DMT)-like permease